MWKSAYVGVYQLLTFHLVYKKNNQFMLYGAEAAVCSEIYTQQINRVWAEFLSVKLVVARNRRLWKLN